MRVIQSGDTPEGTLKQMLERTDAFSGVIVIGLGKDGSQYLMASHMSMMDKTFLVQFAQSWIMQWFHHENE